VDKTETRDGARSAALGVKGVTNVENRITVGNGPATRTQEATRRAKRNWDNAVLEAKVKARLFEQVGENALKITVKASAGVVTLEGTAPTRHIHATALDTVKATKGVRRVVDRLVAG
jgi:osmotically-inducible protein OsmY